MSEPRLLDRRTAYDGKVLKVGVDRLELPGGGTTELEVIRHAGASVVVVLSVVAATASSSPPEQAASRVAPATRPAVRMVRFTVLSVVRCALRAGDGC